MEAKVSTPEVKNSGLKNPLVKNILSALAVAVFGFILLNLTFLFYALVFQVFQFFIRGNIEPLPGWVPITRFGVFLIIIGLISWLIFRLKIRTLFKAIYMTVPTAVVLVIIGIAFNAWPVMVYIVGGLITLGVLIYFYLTRKPWLYFYSIILVALTLMIYTLLGGEI
jgi:hypothetical protein